MWLFLLTVRYSCYHYDYGAVSRGFSNVEIPVCLASRKDGTGLVILYLKDCYTDGKRRTVSFDVCECRKQVEGEKYIYNNNAFDRAIFCYNLTDTTQPTSTPKPTKTPQATKISLPECSHYKKPKTTLAVFIQLLFTE